MSDVVTSPVFLSGPHFAGKSTIAHHLYEQHGFAAMIYSRPGEVAYRYFGCRPSEVPEESRQVFQNLAFFEQLDAENVCYKECLTRWVIDRSLIDFAVYTKDETVKQSILICAKQRYTEKHPHFLVKPLPGKPIDDGKRFLTDPQELWHNFVSLYDQLGIPYEIVEVDTLENRVKFILDSLERNGYGK